MTSNADKEKLIVVKIGGNVIDDERPLRAFLTEFSSVPGKKILVHGGGKIATSIGEKAGIKSTYIDGRRITDDGVIDLVTMVYGGLVNKKIVALLQAAGCNSLGITGADANLIPAIKRPVKKIDYGWVGDVLTSEIPVNTWSEILRQNIVPVVAPLTHDGQGNILNTNADTIASCIAVALSGLFAVDLVYCFEKEGILSDIEDEHSVIPHLYPALYAERKSKNTLFAGILPKIDNAFDALNEGVNSVSIGHSAKLSDLLNKKSGTILSNHGPLE